MRIMCDTNIIIDVLLDREPFSDASDKVLRLCENGRLDGYTTASCITDIFYIVHKHLHDAERSYHYVGKVLEILKVCDVTSTNIHDAMKRKAPDFEDCLVAICAKSIQCDCIVTRDTKGFSDCGLPFCAPEEFLAMNENNNLW